MVFGDTEIDTADLVRHIDTDGVQVGTGNKHGYFAILASRTTIDYHAFEDWGLLETVDSALGYASFDARPTMTNPNHQNHFVGYQARQIYNGAGNLTNYMHGFDAKMLHTGAGTIALSAGMYIYDVGGAGPITLNYGLYIENIARGATNYAIYAAGGKNYFAGRIEATLMVSVIKDFGINYGLDVANKTIALGYGTGGTDNFGSLDFYDGKTTRKVSVDQTGLTVRSGSLAIVAGVAGLASYTFASLPTAAAGSMAYCSNGRKVGEGAGAGTGVIVYYSGGAWKVFSTDATVTI